MTIQMIGKAGIAASAAYIVGLGVICISLALWNLAERERFTTGQKLFAAMAPAVLAVFTFMAMI